MRWKRLFWVGLVALLVVVGGTASYHYRWQRKLLGVPSMHALPINTDGYEIEHLPQRFRGCFARGGSAYYIDSKLNLCRLDDDRAPDEAVVLGPVPIKKARWLHVTQRGTFLVSGDGEPVYRSDDQARTWHLVNHCPCCAADEDDAERVIYAGNYTPPGHSVYRACLFRSLDDGRTWEEIFRDPTNHHVHSVRLDPPRRRIILCIGDSDVRGEVYSDDLGRTWTWIHRGHGHGNTDVVLTPDYAIWGSDDHRGRIYRTDRAAGLETPTQIIQGPRHQIWGMVATGSTVYAGTYCEHPECRDAAHLLASADQGATWQNVLEIPSPGDSAFGFMTTSPARPTPGGRTSPTTTITVIAFAENRRTPQLLLRVDPMTPPNDVGREYLWFCVMDRNWRMLYLGIDLTSADQAVAEGGLLHQGLSRGDAMKNAAKGIAELRRAEQLEALRRG